MENRDQIQTKKQAGLYLLLVFGVGWLGLGIAWLCGFHYGDDTFRTLTTTMMFLPAVGALICRKVYAEGFDLDGLGIRPHLRGNIRRYLFAYFLPTFLAILTAVLFFAVYPAKYDAWGSEFTGMLVQGGASEENAQAVLYSQVILGVLAGPLVNIITSFVEMLGFQGYLLPKLKGLFPRLAGLKSALLGSALWALWYLPLGGDGYLYGKGYVGAPFLGMALGFVFHTLLGLVLSYLTYKTGSVFPAVFVRGGVKAIAVTAVYFTAGDTSLLLGPSVYGAFGCLALLLFALIYVLRILRMEQAGTLYYQKNEGLSR